MAKRFFDIVVASVALLVLSPLLIPVVIVLRFTGEGEVFYGQERIGRGGRPFRILKFATMLKNSPALSGGDITTANDPRILPIGRFLRNTKINELPQLINIVRGDMSIIGWRPLTRRVSSLFPSEYWRQLADVRPGLSGVGSIVFRDEEAILSGAADRELVYRTMIAPYKSALELWYASHQSFWLDIKLIIYTVVAVFDHNFDISNKLPDLSEPPAELVALRDRRSLTPAD